MAIGSKSDEQLAFDAEKREADAEWQRQLQEQLREREKIFCINCKHITKSLNCFYCVHPNNTTKEDNWLEDGATKFKDKPHVINMDNDCGDFELRA